MTDCLYQTHEEYCALHSDGIDFRELCVQPFDYDDMVLVKEMKSQFGGD